MYKKKTWLKIEMEKTKIKFYNSCELTSLHLSQLQGSEHFYTVALVCGTHSRNL